MDDNNGQLRWGALGAFGMGGVLFGIAHLQSKEARVLDKLPSITNLKDLRGLEGKAVAARGEVSSSTIYTDTLSKRPAVAVLLEEDEIYCKKVNREWKTESNRLRRSTQCGPLFLKMSHGDRLHLQLGADTDVFAVMEHAVSIPRSHSNSIMRQAFDGILGYMVTGYVQNEYILPTNTTLTAIGKVAVRDPSVKNDFQLEPFNGKLGLSYRSLKDQIQHMDRWSCGLRWAAYGCGVLGVALTGLYCFRLGRRTLQKRRQRIQEEQFLRDAAERQRRREEAAAAADGDAATRPADAPANAQEWHCIVCWDSDGVQMVFPGCGHVAVCQRCSDHLHHCPICRTRSRARRIFYS